MLIIQNCLLSILNSVNKIITIKYNPHIPNIDAISGAPITLSLSLLILNSQCEEGAREGIDIW